jgi:hypothetical protein
MISVKTAKAIHENGACSRYWVFGGNSKYLEIGFPVRYTPSMGRPSSILAKIMNLNKKLFMPDIFFPNSLVAIHPSSLAPIIITSSTF